MNMLKYLNLFIKGCDSKMFDKELRNIASRYSPNLYSCKNTLHLHTKYDSDASIRRYSFFTKNRDDEISINYDIIQPETNFKQITDAVDIEKTIKAAAKQDTCQRVRKGMIQHN